MGDMVGMISFSEGIQYVITLVGFFVTLLFNHIKFKQVIETQINEERRKLYIEIMNELDKVVGDEMIVFDKRYFDALMEFKSKVKLIASNKVVNTFQDYVGFVYQYYSAYQDFCEKYDPRLREDAYKKTIDDQGNEIEIELFSECDIKNFEFKDNKYKKENIPESDAVLKETDRFLNAMRNDIGNKKYIRKSL